MYVALVCVHVYTLHKDYKRLPVVRVFANGPGDRGSIPVRVIPKTLKMVIDTSLLNTQKYKVRIKDKWRYPGKNTKKENKHRINGHLEEEKYEKEVK